LYKCRRLKRDCRGLDSRLISLDVANTLAPFFKIIRLPQKTVIGGMIVDGIVTETLNDNESWIDSSTRLGKDGNDGKGLVMKTI
jgi:hypothetical protein